LCKEAAFSATCPAPLTNIGASMAIAFAAERVRLKFDHEIGADTVMLPASDPGLPTPPVDTITLDRASRFSRVTLLMTDVAVGTHTPLTNDPPEFVPVEMTIS